MAIVETLAVLFHKGGRKYFEIPLNIPYTFCKILHAVRNRSVILIVKHFIKPVTDKQPCVQDSLDMGCLHVVKPFGLSIFIYTDGNVV